MSYYELETQYFNNPLSQDQHPLVNLRFNNLRIDGTISANNISGPSFDTSYITTTTITGINGNFTNLSSVTLTGTNLNAIYQTVTSLTGGSSTFSNSFVSNTITTSHSTIDDGSGNMILGGSLSYPVNFPGGSVAIVGLGNGVICFSGPASGLTLTLPTANVVTGMNMKVLTKSPTITISPASNNFINGTGTVFTMSPFTCMSLTSDGSNSFWLA